MYKKLNIDFEIPEILSDSIDDFIEYLNGGGKLGDCYEEDIRSTLNGCDLCLTESQIDLLRQYYCKGGIYKDVN